MSFDLTGFGKLDNNPNTNVNNIWGYVTSSDNLSTVRGSDYFATVSEQLSVNDVIRVNASDGIEWITVDQVSPSVTTSVEFPVGDIDGSEVQSFASGDTTAGIPVLLAMDAAGGATNTQTITLDQKITVIDFWVVLTSAGTSGDTIQLTDNDDNAITDALDVSGSDQAIVRAGSIDDANSTEAAGNAIKVVETDSSGSDSPSAICYVLAHITA